MFTIRQAQVDAMAISRQRSFLARLQPDMIEALEVAHTSADSETVSAQLREILEQALDNGLSRECDVAQLAFLCARHLGGDIRRMPAPASDILGAVGVPPDLKITMLTDFLAQHALDLRDVG